MSLFKDPKHLTCVANPVFDTIYEPSAVTAWSGIYRCVVCGIEVLSSHKQPLPSTDHHWHPTDAPIRWQLVVASTQA